MEVILVSMSVCSSCNKNIDDDSVYCKYCGKKVLESITFEFSKEKLRDIFFKVEDTLFRNSKYTKEEFEINFAYFRNYKTYEQMNLNDNEYYTMLVDIIFYSGFRASVVSRKIDIIHSYFSNYEIVNKYSSEDIEKICNDSKMIKNRLKIEACIKNAKRFKEIVNKYGSFKEYIDFHSPDLSEDALYNFKRNLEKNFSYIGGITSYHFMTDIGLNVLKPDRVILRIFERLGLIEYRNDYIGAIKAGRAFSQATELSIRYIDIIFVLYGQLDNDDIMTICSEQNPKCDICGVNHVCNYHKQN